MEMLSVSNVRVDMITAFVDIARMEESQFIGINMEAPDSIHPICLLLIAHTLWNNLHWHKTRPPTAEQRSSNG